MIANDRDYLLIREITQGNEAALVRLMEYYKESVFHFVYRYLGNEADCSEVTEEIFFRVFQKAGTYSRRATVKTWIFSIALNLSRDRLRRRKKHRNQISLDETINEWESQFPLIETIASSSPDPQSELRVSETLLFLNTKIQGLPDKLKLPFIFCVMENHSYDECASIIRASRKTVETRIYRARKLLKGLLTEFFGKV